MAESHEGFRAVVLSANEAAKEAAEAWNRADNAAVIVVDDVTDISARVAVIAAAGSERKAAGLAWAAEVIALAM